MVLEGIIHQLGAFAMKAGVEPEDVIVRIFLGNGDFVVSRGLKVIPPFGNSDWGMLLADRSEATKATVIRENDVHKVELQLPGTDAPIGFSAEGEARRPQ